MQPVNPVKPRKDSAAIAQHAQTLRAYGRIRAGKQAFFP